LPFDSALSSQAALLLKTHVFYNRLAAFGVASADSEDDPSLGGKLLYTGELDGPGRALTIAGNIAGASERVDTDKYEKEDARDFALWKDPASETEPAWDTEIGRGRPGSRTMAVLTEAIA